MGENIAAISHVYVIMRTLPLSHVHVHVPRVVVTSLLLHYLIGDAESSDVSDQEEEEMVQRYVYMCMYECNLSLCAC